MNPSEQAAFDTMVAELDAALVRVNEPTVLTHPAFSIEPSSYAQGLCVIVEREATASVRLTLDGEWVRVDINGLEEFLEVPIPGNGSRAADGRPPMQDTFVRLLTSRLTVTYGRRRTRAFLTDAAGHVWCRNTYFGAKIPPRGQPGGGPHQFAAICTND